MKNYKKIIGFAGEHLATSFLEERGYNILQKNWRCFLGEIDIIAEKDGVIVFCEVKAKTNQRFGEPEEMVGKKKQEKLKKLALCYLKEKYHRIVPYRIDVLAIDFLKNEIRLIENAIED